MFVNLYGSSIETTYPSDLPEQVLCTSLGFCRLWLPISGCPPNLLSAVYAIWWGGRIARLWMDLWLGQSDASLEHSCIKPSATNTLHHLTTSQHMTTREAKTRSMPSPSTCWLEPGRTTLPTISKNSTTGFLSLYLLWPTIRVHCTVPNND